MHVLAVFLATIALAAASYPTEVQTWTFMQLAQGHDEDSRPELTPYIDDAFLKIVLALDAANDTSVYAALPSPSGQDTWTKEELDEVIADQPNHPYWDDIDKACNNLGEAIKHGFYKNTIPVGILALDLSLWTHEDIDKALKSDRTNPLLIPLLKKARQDLSKFKKKTVGLVTPVGLIPQKGIPEFLPMPEESVYTWALENDVPIRIHAGNPLLIMLKKIVNKIYSVFSKWFGR